MVPVPRSRVEHLRQKPDVVLEHALSRLLRRDSVEAPGPLRVLPRPLESEIDMETVKCLVSVTKKQIY